MCKTTISILPRLCVAALLSLAAGAHAADWSDTSISWRAGNDFREPFNPDNIKKNIFALTHVSGYKYGTNFLNIDLLQSDSKDPGAGSNASGAQEAYVVYRNTVDIGKVRGSDIKFGPVRGVGATFGFDWNTKNDVGYSSKKRMLVAGPTLMWDVPGHLNTSVLILQESNAPVGVSRYDYKVHPMLTADWGIPLSSLVSFEGYANFIASKGQNEFDQGTAPETNIDMQIMLDVGAALGSAKNTFRAGIEYQYWRNKFGNPSSVTGSLAKTPMLRAEYHF